MITIPATVCLLFDMLVVFAVAKAQYPKLQKSISSLQNSYFIFKYAMQMNNLYATWQIERGRRVNTFRMFTLELYHQS